MEKTKYLYLTSTGHKSGKAHEIEIWYVEHGGCYYLVSQKREASHWVQNIRAKPAIHFRLGDQTKPGIASIPQDPDLIAAVKAKMEEKYNWSNGLVVEICAS